MAIETELKLSCSPQALTKLKRHSFLRGLQQGRSRTVHLFNIYFDTPDFALKQARMAIRLRRSGKQWLQTLKGGGGVQAGLHQRSEWEMPVAGEALELGALKAAGARIPKGVAKHLRTVFRTDFSRSIRELHYEDARIELCLDQGEVSCATGKVDICELELELLEGSPSRLFQLALKLHALVPLELEFVSKAERGYRLLEGRVEAPLKAAPVSLTGLETTGAVLQRLCGSCLCHLQSNLSGAIAGDDPEYLHQLRVAIRRLRGVLALCGALNPDSTLDSFRQVFARLSRSLGRLREQDVFIDEALSPLLSQQVERAGLQALLDIAIAQRQSALAEIRAGHWQRDMQELILQLALWMQGDYWQFKELQLPLKSFRRQTFKFRGQRFLKQVERLEMDSPASLHRLRISSKKIRYLMELFGMERAFRGKPYASLVRLQEHLGKYNDAVNVEIQLRRLMTSVPSSSTLQEACKQVQRWNRTRQAGLHAGIPQRIRHAVKSLQNLQS